jgi:hypothetical protein
MFKQWLVMFTILFALDFVYAKWTQTITAGHATPAAGWAALCYALTGLATVQYVADPWLLIPAVLGCMCGTFAAVKFRGKS